MPFATALLTWSRTLHRPMPWRGERDPYRIWLSEVILQQTRVAQGTAYYLRFLEAFPTVTELAAAPEQQVMALWQGLGYYSRARNLHAAARLIVGEWGGQLPRDYDGLLKLPGVGPYTAAAIASFAYDESVAVVDGNVYRVLARAFGMNEPINTPAGQRAFRTQAEELLDRDRPAAYNQAIMDFGATVCTPKSPACPRCPLRASCVALAEGRVGELPVKLGKAKRRTRYFDYVHLVDDAGRLLLAKRGPGDVWQGLYDMPLVESATGFAERTRVQASLPSLRLGEADEGGVSLPVKHVLSHQDIRARFWRYKLTGAAAFNEAFAVGELTWVAPAELATYGIPRLLDRYLSTAELF